MTLNPPELPGNTERPGGVVRDGLLPDSPAGDDSPESR